MIRTPFIMLFLTVLTALPVAAKKKDGLTADQLRELSTRTLVVELPTVEEWTQAKGPVSDTLGSVVDHRSYLANIEAAVRNSWSFNEQVEFKSRTECRALFTAGSKDYLVMMKGQVGYYDISTDHYTHGLDKLMFCGTEVPLPINKNGEMTKISSSFQFFEMYLVGKGREDTPGGAYPRHFRATYNESGLSFTLVQLQRSLEWGMANGEYHAFPVYAKEEAARNCSKLKGRTLTALQNNLGKSGNTEEDLREAYGGKVEFVSYEDLTGLYADREEGTALLFLIPFARLREEMDIIYGKLVVDAGTGEIIGVAGFTAIGERPWYYSDSLFKKLTECE